MKQVVRMHDPVKREDRIMVFKDNEQLLKHLEDNPHNYIDEFIDIEIPYKPYSGWQLFWYIFIGSVIGNFIGIGIGYFVMWVMK